MNLFIFVLLWSCHASNVDQSILENTAFIVLSQPDTFHSSLAQDLKENLQTSLKQHGISNSPVLLTGQDLPQHGSWTIFPVISHLANRLKLEAKWFIFLDVMSSVDLANLSKLLIEQSSAHFIGSALEDEIHSIIHHFKAPRALKYPNFEAGFILSGNLVKQMGMSMSVHGPSLDWIPDSFSIDAQYELAEALQKRDEKHTLVHSNKLCVEQNSEQNCAIFQRAIDKKCDSSSQSVKSLLKETLFGVKTCVKYHQSRLPIIKGTWAPATSNIMYFSESNDTEYGTVQLDGIQNTDRGHCQKTMAIIKYFADNRHWKWLVIADDDTILSVEKLVEYLHCFKEDEKVFLGQRYGYRVAFGTHGYDYITGGGGMILNRKMVEAIVESKRCQCSSPDAPDDMHLGMCLSKLGLSLVHSPRFHQARPDDYALNQLVHQDPISFHKFWENDPYKVYDAWFRQADKKLLPVKDHDEL